MDDQVVLYFNESETYSTILMYDAFVVVLVRALKDGDGEFHVSHHSNSSFELRNLLRAEIRLNRYSYWRPPQGADSTMDTHDWRAQLLPHVRQIKVDEIMSKLQMDQSHGDDDESLDVQKISESFEQKTYAGASSEEDYLQKISSMMQLIDIYTWRAQLQPDSRQRIVNKMVAMLKIHLPFSGEEGLAELHKIALRFEEKMYNTATSRVQSSQF